ncbi:hypothetical protein [Bdellovibrio sp. HCB337]|uniref:hypothetical protein n=1 Tax=Bdellovibrio sp. HCB337 TaxID=3394358 RepID=UPI0039A4432F
MQKLIACLLICASLSAKAASELESQVLAAVIANASSIVLLDPSSEQPFPQDQQLPALLAKALLQNYSQLGTFGGELGNVSISCDETEYIAAENAIAYGCMIYIGVGEFRKDNDTLTGPQTEGSLGFHVYVFKPWNPSEQIIIDTTETTVEIGE